MRNKYLITAECFDKRGRSISKATNSYTKTHPLQAYFAEKVGHPHRKYLHAEIAAIIKAGDKKIDQIFIRRFDKKGHQANAEPCPICKEAIKAFGIKRIMWTT
jgi:tRNA(Arg) A34 adenosine deaminase TadA